MKTNRIIASVLALILLLSGCFCASAEEAVDVYTHPVLVFRAPSDAEIIDSVATSESYLQTLFCPDSCETIISGAFASLEEAEAEISALFGEAALSAEYAEDLDAVSGYYAQHGTFTFGTNEDASLVNFVLVYSSRTYLFASVIPLTVYMGNDNGESYADLIGFQIGSLEIFDPCAALFMEYDDETFASAREPVANIVLNPASSPIRLSVLSDICDVTISTVTLNNEGSLIAGDIVFTAAELTSGDSLIIRTELPDALPGFAVSYTTANGEAQIRLATFSGLDGTLMFIEG